MQEHRETRNIIEYIKGYRSNWEEYVERMASELFTIVSIFYKPTRNT
jgi:hypothetical protein